MLWIRGLMFTLLVPGMVALMVPRWLSDGDWTAPWPQQVAGWVLIAAGSAFYALSLLRFLGAGGTPSIYFARPLRGLLGEEPQVLVERGLYGITRNPMYVGVISVVLGQALLYGSWAVGLYGLALAPIFHLVVTVIEEPHLREERGTGYEEYCRRVARWFIIKRDTPHDPRNDPGRPHI